MGVSCVVARVQVFGQVFVDNMYDQGSLYD